MAMIEHTDGNSNELTSILQSWQGSVELHQREHSKVHDWGGHHPIYTQSSRDGKAMIEDICSRVGPEAIRSIIDGVSNLGLKTQLQILALGSETQGAEILDKVLSDFVPNKTKPDKPSWPDHYLEERAYRGVLTKMIEVKFPGDLKLSELIGVFPEPKDVLRAVGRRTQAIEALEISLGIGPGALLEFLELIPLEQLSGKNFSERLAIEQRLLVEESVSTQREYIFRGQVQDVGFRANCREVAQRWGLRGFARNELDGSVTVMVQGYPELISAFLRDFYTHARENMKISFGRQDMEEVVIEREFEGFSIKRAERPLKQPGKKRRLLKIFKR